MSYSARRLYLAHPLVFARNVISAAKVGLIPAVARHASAELTIREESDQLRKDRAAQVHPSWWQRRVCVLDFQIAAR
jgi:hypothetical protein